MPELDTQLRSYVESNIERVDIEDVTAMVLDQPWVEKQSTRRIRPAWVFGMAAAVVVILIGGAAWLLVGDSSSDLAAAPGTVEVTIKDIERPVIEGPFSSLVGGWQLAGVLFEGDSDLDFTKGLGGFAAYAANVDGDPFSTTQLVRQPAGLGGPFPYVTEDVLYLEPGDYTLMIWLGRGLVGFSRWIPADQPGIVGCETILEVEPGQNATVTVIGGLTAVVGIPMPPCVVKP